MIFFQTDNSTQRDEARQRKLGKALEWDQDKPTLESDGNYHALRVNFTDALPNDDRYYNNYNRRGQGGNFEDGRRGRGRGRYGRRGDFQPANRQTQPPPPPTDETDSWPALPAVIPAKEGNQS
jgi:hypothetical protein